MATKLIRLSMAATLLLAGCAAPRSVAPPSASAATPLPVSAASRVDGVVGSTLGALVARFGAAALDATEGAARKLQYVHAACVLDLYLYAPREGAEPEVTHADARSPDGSATDMASCVAALGPRTGG